MAAEKQAQDLARRHEESMEQNLQAQIHAGRRARRLHRHRIRAGEAFYVLGCSAADIPSRGPTWRW
jgi:hypothetical protein